MMFTLDIKTVIAACTLIPAGLLIIIWLSCELFRRPLTFALGKQFLWQCEICTYIYINIEGDLLSICPRCGSYNKRIESKEQKG